MLDVGCGDGLHLSGFRSHGIDAVGLDIKPPADFVGDYLSSDVGLYDCIWSSHVLEHQLDVHRFLVKCFSDLRMGGLLSITVPPLKHELVGGHLTLWNEGLLVYNLILAGFDCRHARVGVYGYNLSVLVEKSPVDLPDLKFDFGDIEVLSEYFPWPVVHGVDGRLGGVNW